MQTECNADLFGFAGLWWRDYGDSLAGLRCGITVRDYGDSLRDLGRDYGDSLRDLGSPSSRRSAVK
jgi:hypothetical protein